LRYGFDGWQQIGEKTAARGPFGMYAVTFAPGDLEPHVKLHFTRRFENGWEGTDYLLSLGHVRVEHALVHEVLS
jgi:hypothetical protein